MIDFELKRPGELTDAERGAWTAIVEERAEFGSPYFRPEFAEHVAAVRDDVEVVVLAVDGAPAGFFPFQRSRCCVGRPLAGRLSDFHGVVVREGVEWSPDALMRASRMKSWHFDHLLASQSPFERHHWVVEGSPYLDLSCGFDAYEKEQRSSSDFKQILRKDRKLHREHEVRFEWNAGPELLVPLIAWKTRQYLRTDTTDVFSFDWTRRLLERIASDDGDGFGGVLSVLWIDGEPAAIHFGMRSRTTLHYWFPAYDIEFQKCTPGAALQLAIARECPQRGLVRIDLGKGDERYKLKFANASVDVAEGIVETSAIGGSLRRGWKRTKQWVKSSPLSGAARLPARLLRAVRERNEFT